MNNMDTVVPINKNYKTFVIEDYFVPLICNELNCSINEFASKIKNYNGKYKSKIRSKEYHNLVPLAIRSSLATLTTGTDVTPSFKANYIAIGNDNTTPTIDDVILGNELLRGTFTNRYAIDNKAFLDKYWGSTEVGGNTYLEIGIFCDASAVINTGYLMSRVVIDEQLAPNESLTINATISYD